MINKNHPAMKIWTLELISKNDIEEKVEMIGYDLYSRDTDS